MDKDEIVVIGYCDVCAKKFFIAQKDYSKEMRCPICSHIISILELKKWKDVDEDDN